MTRCQGCRHADVDTEGVILVVVGQTSAGTLPILIRKLVET